MSKVTRMLAAIERGEPQAAEHCYPWSMTNCASSPRRNYQQNGFVVSGPPGGASFAEVFYNLFYSDLPVFVSTDALLEAWHRTYDAMLEETEEWPTPGQRTQA
jgi:hypothetical protein